MKVIVTEFTPVFAEEWQAKLDGGVEICFNASQALKNFRKLYPEGAVVGVEQLSNPFMMDIEEYKEFHAWD
jgi:hypothetical protein